MKRLGSVLLPALLICGLAWQTWEAAAGDVSDNVGQYAIAGGVLRDGGEGWRWYTNGHAGENTGPVTCTSAGIVEAGIADASGPVGFGSVDPDETLARSGVTAGVSANRGLLRIYLFRNGSPISCSASLFDSQWANLWVLWMVPL